MGHFKGFFRVKIIIVGAGEVGFHLAKMLSVERHDITIVDPDPDRIERSRQHLDVMAVEGSGTSTQMLEKLGAREADLLIAVTSFDEVNVLSCMIAGKLGTRRRIARVSNYDLLSEESPLSPQDFGIDLTVYPEGIAAQEVVRLIKRSAATDVLEFAEGRIQIIGLKLDGQSPLINRKLSDVVKDYKDLVFRAVAISRGGRTIIPTGEDVFRKNDQVFSVSKTEFVQDMLKLAGKEAEQLNNVMILGGGKVGRHVAELLQHDCNVKLIESKKDVSEELAGSLERTLVIHGEASDIDLLATEGIMDMDAYIAVTEDEETNIISCLMAKHLGVKKTIAMIDNLDYLPLAGTIGLDVAVNKKLSVAQVILKFVRKGEIVSVATLHGVDAEVIEFIAQKGSVATKKPLREIKFPAEAIVGCIIHADDVTIPVGESRIQPGDRVVVFTLPKAIPAVEKFFSK